MDVKFVMPTITFVLEKASSGNPRKIIRLHPSFFEPAIYIKPQSLFTAAEKEKVCCSPLIHVH
jgi:hypothetical protein